MAKKITEAAETPAQAADKKKVDDALKSDNPYEALKVQKPARTVELPAYKPPVGTAPAGGGAPGTPGANPADNPYKTISQAMENTADLTDMQYALSILLPKEDKMSYASLMIADISPEVFFSGMHMSAMDEIMCSDPRAPIDVNKIYMKHYTIWSIGLDREGRMDVADIAGAARAEKKLQSSLGLRGLSS